MGFLSDLRRALPRAGRSGSRRGADPIGRTGSPTGKGRGQRSLMNSALNWIGGRRRRR